MRGNAAFIIGGVTIVVAVASLVFILWTLTSYSERCKSEVLDICDTLSGASFPLLIVALTVAGLILVSSTVVYILLRAQ